MTGRLEHYRNLIEKLRKISLPDRDIADLYLLALCLYVVKRRCPEASVEIVVKLSDIRARAPLTGVGLRRALGLRPLLEELEPTVNTMLSYPVHKFASLLLRQLRSVTHLSPRG